ncbi:MAG: hypothetical protein U1E76_08040 [Planctomycetota bacterium]
MDYRIRPDGRELIAAARGTTDASARRTAPRIYLDAFGLRFEILPGGVVRGPYCASCRRIQGETSFTDWSTAERAPGRIDAHCAHCGAAFAVPTHDAAALCQRAQALFTEHLALLERELGS